MPTIIVDDAMRDVLRTTREDVEIRDRQGRLLGKLPVESVPCDDFEIPTDDELDRIMREDPSYTAEQVEERLRALKGVR
jgi:hypothetical protein